MEGWQLFLQISSFHLIGMLLRNITEDCHKLKFSSQCLITLYLLSFGFRLGHKEQKDEWIPRRIEIFTKHNVLPPDALISAGSINSACTAGRFCCSSLILQIFFLLVKGKANLTVSHTWKLVVNLFCVHSTAIFIAVNFKYWHLKRLGFAEIFLRWYQLTAFFVVPILLIVILKQQAARLPLVSLCSFI